MVLIVVVVLVIAVTLFFTLTIRTKDLPPPDPVSPAQYLGQPFHRWFWRQQTLP